MLEAATRLRSIPNLNSPQPAGTVRPQTQRCADQRYQGKTHLVCRVTLSSWTPQQTSHAGHAKRKLPQQHMLSGTATYKAAVCQQNRLWHYCLARPAASRKNRLARPNRSCAPAPQSAIYRAAPPMRANPWGESNPARRRGVPQSTPGTCHVLGAMAQGTPKPCPGHANGGNARSCTHKVCATNSCTAAKPARRTTHVGREPWRRPMPNPHKRLAQQAGEKASSLYMSLCEALCG